jgi:hypothetical protein
LVVGSKPSLLELLALLAQVEEQLALGLGGADLHQPPVVEDELEDVGADPEGRVGRQLDPAVRIVLPHRLHQADVALLHQVEQVLVAAVLVGDLHHQAQVGLDELARRRRCRRARPAGRERVLLLGREQRVAPHLLHVLAHRVAPAGKKAERVRVRVGTAEQEFQIGDVEALWAVGTHVREVFRFVNRHTVLSDDEQRTAEYAIVEGVLGTLDPHTNLLRPDDFETMKTSTKGSFGGLGIEVGMRDTQITVIRVIDGNPAAKAGIEAGDRIVQIDEESTVTMGLSEAVDRMRGEPGTTVTLYVRREGSDKVKKVPITRDVITLDSVQGDILPGADAKGNPVKVGLVQINRNFCADHRQGAASQARRVREGRRTRRGPRHARQPGRPADGRRRGRRRLPQDRHHRLHGRQLVTARGARGRRPLRLPQSAGGRADRPGLCERHGDRRRSPAQPRPRSPHRPPHLRKGLCAGAARPQSRRQRARSEADDRPVPHPWGRLDPVCRSQPRPRDHPRPHHQRLHRLPRPQALRPRARGVAWPRT